MVMTSPLLTSITFPDIDAAFTSVHRKQSTANAAISVMRFMNRWERFLDSKLFRELQFGLPQLEAAAPQITLRIHREYDEVVFALQPHQHRRAFE